MNKSYKNQIVFAVSVVMMQMTCLGSSYFQIVAKSNIYSPSTFVVTTQLTGMAALQGKWRVDLAVYVDKELVRKESLPVIRKRPAVTKVDFPEVRKIVNGRVRVELYLDDEFIEGIEKKISIWPRPVDYNISDKKIVIWAYDKSGSLQKVFKSINVKAVDATFQTARDFSKPDIIFVGENADSNDLKVIDRHLMVSGNKPVIVFLKQNQFAKNGFLEICKSSIHPSVIFDDTDAGIFKGLGRFNLMNLIANTRPVCFRDRRKIKTLQAKLWINKVPSETGRTKSYAGMITKRDHKTIYCQISVINGLDADPPKRKLFFNLLDLAITQAKLDADEDNEIEIENLDEDNIKERKDHEKN